MIGITAEHLATHWPVVEPLLAKATPYSFDGISTDLLKKWIEARDAQLWVTDGAAIVTKIVIYPHLKALQIVALGGSGMRKWLPDVELTLEAYGRFHGCSRLEVIGRKGWSRVLKNTRIAAITITRKL